MRARPTPIRFTTFTPSMREAQAKAIHLKDYAPPAYLITGIALDVDIRADDALSKATLSVRRNPALADRGAPLVLDGEELELLSISLNGNPLAKEQYKVAAEQIVVDGVPETFTLETVSRLCPQKNTALEGL